MSGHIPPFTYIEEVRLSGAGTTQGPSIPLGYDACTGVSFQNEWNRTGTATLAGTITVEGSNDPRALPGHPDFSSAIWIDVTTEWGMTDPTSGAGTSMENVSNVRYEFIRFSLAYVSGNGLFKSTFSAHGVGG